MSVSDRKIRSIARHADAVYSAGLGGGRRANPICVNKLTFRGEVQARCSQFAARSRFYRLYPTLQMVLVSCRRDFYPASEIDDADGGDICNAE